MTALVLVLILSMSTAVFSAANTYVLPELGLTVTIPPEYWVITSDTSAGAQVFKEIGTTKEALMKQFEADNIYLNAISDSFTEEIVVTMTANSISDFNLFSDTALDTFVSSLVNEFANYGIIVSEYEIYQHSQAKFAKIYFSDTAKTVHGLQYYTIYDGKAINFTIRSYTGSLSREQESTMKTVVDSIEFDTAPLTPEPGEDTDPFTYEDPKTGARFTVPANWRSEALMKDRETIDVKYVCTKDTACSMMYGSMDVWGSLSASERIGYSRSDIDNSLFTKDLIAESYNVPTSSVEVVKFNGAEYYLMEMEQKYEVSVLEIPVVMTVAIRVENGWMYMFQFGGRKDHKLFSDFESLLNSVQYPGASNGFGTDTHNYGSGDPGNDFFAAGVGLVIIAAVIIFVVVIARKKKAVPANALPPQNIAGGTPRPAAYCRHCGQALPPESTFCHMCGTKIIEEEDQ